MKATRTISTVTAALVLFLAIGAFVLSYDALQGLALENGISPSLAWLWPLLVDGAIIVFSLAVLRGSLLGERTIYAWSLVILFVALSVTFNVIHARPAPLPRVVAAVPPVALALAFELFTGQVKAEVTRGGVALTLKQMTRQVAERQAELDTLSGQVERMSTRVDALKEARQDLESANRRANDRGSKQPEDQSTAERLLHLEQANQSRQEIIEARRKELAGLMDGDMTQVEMAEQLGVSVSTIRRDLRALTSGSNGKQAVVNHG